MPGQAGRQRRKPKITAAEPTPSARAAGAMVGSAEASVASLGIRGPGSAPCRWSPVSIADLTGEDGDGDTAGETHGHRMGDVAYERAEPGKADQREHDARQRHGEQQAVQAEPRSRRRHQHDEGAGGAADLVPAAAKSGNQKAADDGGVETALRRHARGHGNGHGERQGDDRDGQGGKGVLAERRRPVALAQ